MEISHFHVIIKSKVGVDFDVPHDVPHDVPMREGTSKSTPILFFIIVNQMVVHSRLMTETMLGG
jgi:hypothetical protein